MGYPALFDNNTGKVVFSGFIIRFRPNFSLWNSRFLTYAMCSDFIRKNVIAFASVSANTNINQESLKKISVPCPSLIEQQKIASILSNVDELIQKIEQIIEQTQRLKKGLMQRLLTKGIRHTKFKKETISFSLFKKEIPYTWNILKLNQLCKVVRGGSPRSAGDPKYFGGKIPWITVGDLTKDDQMYLNLVEKGLTEEGKDKSRYLKKGVVVLANSDATLGVPKILNIAGCINDGVAAFLDLKKELQPEYLYYILFSWIHKFRNINQGMGQPNLNTEIIGNLYIPVPPINEQKQIILFISNIDLKIQKELFFYNQIERIKKGLMQQLLTGKIRVKI